MKTIKLFLSRIYFYFTSNKLIFCMFLIGSFVCSISFIFLYGNQVSTKKAESSLDPAYKIYSMSFEKPISYNDINSKSFLKSNIIYDIDISHYLSAKELPKELFSSSENVEIEDGFFTIDAVLYNKDENFSKFGRAEFSDKELTNGENVVVLPSYEGLYSMKNKSYINISGTKYEIIGMSTRDFEFLVPAKNFENLNYSINQIEIQTTDKMSRKDNAEFIEKLHEAFPEGTLTSSPTDYYNSADNNYLEGISLIAFMFIICSLSFMFLFKFMIDQSNAENIIYSIVGANKAKIIFILILENAFLSGIVAIIASILHKILYNSIFNHINIFDGIEYSLKDYLLIIVMIIILSCITSLPFIISCIKNSIIKNKNKYG